MTAERRVLESRRSIQLREKKQRRSNILAMLLSGVVVAVVAVFFLFSRQGLEAKNEQYEQKIKVLNQQVEEQKEREASLEERKKYVQTKQYIEEVAKSKLGLLYPDEIILKPVTRE